MDNRYFQNHKETLMFKYDKITGYQVGARTIKESVPHQDPKILAKDPDARLTTGKVTVYRVVQLMLEGGTAVELGIEDSIEFLEFIEKCVKPEIWKAEKRGKPLILATNEAIAS